MSNSDSPKHNFGWWDAVTYGTTWNWQDTMRKRHGLQPRDNYDDNPDDDQEGWWG
jgi:hypothetical protein